MIVTHAVMGLFIVYLVNNSDPNLGPHAVGLYFLALFIDVLMGRK